MNILIFCLPGIGDALMATPMIKLLKQHTKANIDVACMFDGVRYIFKNNPYVDNVHRLSLYKENPLKGLHQILALRKYRYDVSILAYPAYRREYHLINWLAGSPKRVSHRYSQGYWTELHFLNNHLFPIDDEEHIVINNLNLLKAFDIRWEDHIQREKIIYDLHLDKEDIQYGKDFLGNLGWKTSETIGIHPGSINSKVGILKRWPVEKFAKLAKKIIQKNKKIIIFVGPDEMEIGEKLHRLINDYTNVALLCNLKFNQALGILNTINVLITNDNGFAHLANALRIQSIVIFGPTNPVWCQPYNEKYVQIVRDPTFNPWFRNDMKVTQPPSGAKSGMEKIPLRDIFSLVS